MSWYVEGKRYVNYVEYQEALARAERRRAEKAAASLGAENQSLEAEIVRDSGQLDAAGGDLVRQMEIGRRMEGRLRMIERNRRRADELLEQTGRRMREGLTRMERELVEQNGKLHGVEVDLEQMRSSHRRHAEEMARNLENARGELRAGLERAEKLQREGQQRLQQSVNQMERKLEDDRAERARRHGGQLKLAESEAAAATLALERSQAEAQPMGLDAELHEVQAHLASARDLAAREEAGPALAVSSMARSAAESMEREARARRVEIGGVRAEVEERLARVENTIGSAASRDLRDCYGPELRRLQGSLDAANARLANRYRDYRLLPVERREDEELLEQMEGEALEMTASAPVTAEAAVRRTEQLEEVLDGLEKVYGGMTSSRQCFAIPDDPKSGLIVNAVFGSSQVQLTLGLDGAISLDGYGHGSAGECAAAAARVLEELQSRTLVRHSDTEGEARKSPRTRGTEGGAR